MNAGELVAAVYDSTGYRPDDGLVTPDVVLRGVNRALRAVAAERDWPWLQASTSLAVVAATVTYALPADYVRTRRLVNDDGVPLERADARQLEDEFGEETGDPSWFAVDGELLVLRPIATRALTYAHFYVRREKVLVGDGETPYLPTEWQDAVVQLAEAYAHRAGRAPDRADEAQKGYDTFWRSRMLDDVRRTRGPLRARVRAGSAL